MPVLTGAELKAARLSGNPEKKIKPVDNIPEIKVPEVEESTEGYRMHHPDDPTHSMNCTIEVNGKTVQIKQGVAVVDEMTAREFERRGWLRGAKVDDYDNFE